MVPRRLLIGCCAALAGSPRPLAGQWRPWQPARCKFTMPTQSSPGKVVHRLPLGDLFQKNLLSLRCAINWRRDPHLKTAKSLYCVCAEYPDHRGEWTGAGKLGLEDSFATWHGVTALHLWLVMQRLRAIGEDRQASLGGNSPIDYPTAYVVYGMGRLFHRDIRQRLQDFPSYSGKSTAAAKLFNKFQYLNLLYKLAYLDSDLVLAETLWRQVCMSSPRVDAHSLMLLVRYVRANYRHLQAATESDLLGKGMATFLPVVPRPDPESTKAWMRERLKYALAPQAGYQRSEE